MKVLFLPEVEDFLFELTELLYQKAYFGQYSSAQTYVNELVKEIQKSIHLRPYLEAPVHFRPYGKDLHYASFRKNKTTQWYVFFTIHHRKEETIYLIRYISNNHVIAKYL